MDKPAKIRFARNVAIVAGAFTLLMSLLMLFNYFQLSSHDPIENETLKALVDRLGNEPGNEALLNEIRAFDLMARKAYFTSKWQI
ncbi:MAG TPA: hypothetical protein PLK12_14750, partial [Prolixibacteraceae bacterium]|nr:hypothetical protein [Prolixibacteraceae bacterium]